MNASSHGRVDDQATSDGTILVSIEELINTTFGPSEGNQVNFKLLQTILHILARQMRLLKQDVEIKIDEITESEYAVPLPVQEAGYDDKSGTYSSSSAEVEKGEGGAERKKSDDRQKITDRAGKQEKEDKKERKGSLRGEKEDGKTSSKDREGKGRSKDRDGSRRGRRGEDYEDEGGRVRGRGKERDGERGADGRGGRGGEREDKDRDRSRRRRRSEDSEDEGGRVRGRGKERGEERGTDERGGRGGEREHKDRDRSRRGRRSEDSGDEGGRVRRRRRRGERDSEEQDLTRGGLGRDSGRQTSGTSITVSETTRRGPGRSADKILVAERGPAAPSGVRPARIGSIEVVTASQFALLEKAVKQLEQITGPLPEPVLPDNKTLRQDLATGRASLQDTMQAVQLSARVQAAEQGLYRMAELLTQLAQSGMLPPEFAGDVGTIEEYLQATMAAGYAAGGPDEGGATVSTAPQMDVKKQTVAADAAPQGRHGKKHKEIQLDAKKHTLAPSAQTSDAGPQGKPEITQNEMQKVLNYMKEALFKEINSLTAQANHSADVASNTARSVAAKMDIASQIDGRITNLLEQTEDYAQQFKGIDSGIMTQVQNFQEQLAMMRNDLAGGLALLEEANNNAETAALLDLTERHQGLVSELENTTHLHQNLDITQHQIGDELRNLIEVIEMLREQKADRDEVLDGLRDKADISRLAGLLYEKDFAHARSEIEKRISMCYEVFGRQNEQWQEALAELRAIANNKAEIIMLMSLKDSTNAELNAIHKLLRKLEIMLGEPNAAILLRQLAKDATCGACMTRAHMEPQDATYGKPLPLPALRLPPLGVEQQPCLGEVKLSPPDIRIHTCRRWVGGSHTLMSNISKEKAEYMQVQILPTKKYQGYGFDGRLYMMEDDMEPCAECNKLNTDEVGRVSPHPPTPAGAGDQASAPTRQQ